MKKLILLLLLFPLLATAQKYDAKITYADGTVRTGQAKYPALGSYSLKFWPSDGGSTEKIENKLLTSMELSNDKETMSFLSLRWGFWHAGAKKYKYDKEDKTWGRILKHGKIDLILYISGESASTNGGSDYQIHKPGEDYSHPIHIAMGGLIVNAGSKSIQKACEDAFKDDCPELAKLITKEVIKKNGLEYIVDLYDANCGK